MAGDRLISDGSSMDTVCKIKRESAELYGVAGDIVQATNLRDSIINYLIGINDNVQQIEDGVVLRLCANGTIYVYHGSILGIRLTNTVSAIGSGASAALSAYACGKTLVECVAIASKIDLYTGMGVDYLERL